MRRPAVRVVLAVLVALLLGGCGGSSSSSSTSSSSSASATSSTSTTSNNSASSTTSTTSTGAPTTATSSAASPTVTSTSSTSAGPDTNVRLAAKFTIQAAGTLFPPVVAAPKHTTIVLTVRSHDGRRHTLALVTPHPYTVSVAPGATARLVLKGLANGAYVVRVDGAVRGRLIVGAAPGP